MENIKWIEINNVDEFKNYAVDFATYLQDFLSRSRLNDTFENYWNMVVENIGKKTFGFFISEEDGIFSGFLINSIAMSIENNFLTCEIMATYIKPGKNKNTWNLGFPVVEKWAKDRGCFDISTRSHRNPKAFYKKIRPQGFDPYCIMLNIDNIDDINELLKICMEFESVSSVLFRKKLYKEIE